ncbi:acyl-CoA synthetase (AMP-forming)/AMP-acid ligase II [Litoreibacter halocynthiae]|uniref:Acyl-CoA synthetase (AMP-forming)/AMP-acid ligase II n=1 Tax=Litoreibacter halocynthiae TaxID=1242689 RepID=A0A4R7LND7_9RHOB|nr:AMP-binding protein [Litoreibacter halocynthiae]TDT75660.1 acyl-CoA synthetase (AMP-forming)/AMP-acid ligase II [Litoreibacter halocynthiae]
MIFDPASPPVGTVRDWLDARAEGDGIAIVFPETGETLGWRSLRNEARQIAEFLTALGVAKGESVAIVQPNGREGVIATYATLYGGFRATMINLAAGPAAISYALDHSGARFAFVHASQADTFSKVAPDGVTALKAENIQTPAILHDINSDDHALLMYTSGTTGKPKGVVHSHASLLAGGWTTAVAHALTPQDRGFCVLPIYHINGLCVTVIGALVSGGSLAMVSRFSASKFWDQVEAGEATWFSVVPTIISHLLHGSSNPDGKTRARLRFGRSASSALAIETQSAFEGRFEVPIIETMGLTETAAQILSNPLPPGVRKIGSPGVGYGNSVQIMTPQLTEAARDTEGEIAVRGPNVMREYLHNPQATAGTFAGDWLRTGDLGRMDADGYVFVTGRLKELIIKGGENIAPREIDEVLYGLNDVVEAAAFARPCPQYGERVEAAVALIDGSTLSEAELISRCIERLGAFKSPEKVHILNELPKGPSGKIQRLKLAELL